MSWSKIDDGWPTNPKLIRAGLDGRDLYLCAICEVNRHLTAGIILRDAIPNLGSLAPDLEAATAKLLRLRLFHDLETATECRSNVCREGPRPGPDELLIHDFADYSEDREEVLERRAAAAARTRKHRAAQRYRRRDGRRDVSVGVSPGQATLDVTEPVTPASREHAALARAGGVARVPDPTRPGKPVASRPGVVDPNSKSAAPRKSAARGSSPKPGSNGQAPAAVGAIQPGLIAALERADPRWAELRWAPLVRLGKRFGREHVTAALQRLREAPPAELERGPIALLTATCQAVAERGQHAESQAQH